MQYLDIWGGVRQEGAITQREKGAGPLTPIVCILISYLIIFPVDQGQLELELSGINGEHPRTTLPVQAIHIVALHPRDIDG